MAKRMAPAAVQITVVPTPGGEVLRIAPDHLQPGGKAIKAENRRVVTALLADKARPPSGTGGTSGPSSGPI